ncbi:MAG: hypothetical protein ABS894_00915 [Aerococcus urinaeequi]
MDKHQKKMLKDMQRMPLSELRARVSEIFALGMNHGAVFYEKAMAEEKRISGPMAARVKARAAEMAKAEISPEFVDKDVDK